MNVLEWAEETGMSVQTIRKWVFGDKYKHTSLSGLKRVLNKNLEIDKEGEEEIKRRLELFEKYKSSRKNKVKTTETQLGSENFSDPSWWIDPTPECLKDKTMIF